MPRVRAPSVLPVLLACCLVLLALLGGCRRSVVAPGDPVAAVKGMAEAVRDNDLVRYSRLSMPPELHERMEARWMAKLAAAPAPTDKQRRDYARWMQRLTAPGAERQLLVDFNAKMKKFDREIGAQWPLMQATAGMLANGLIQANPRLGRSEKEHGKAIMSALLAWITPDMLADRARASAAIKVLVGTARELDLPTLEDSRRLGMVPALEKGGEVLAGFKQIGRIYGLDADASLDALQARLVDAQGDRATVEVSYPLLGQSVKFEMELVRRSGRWYSADAVDQAEAELLKPLQATPAPAAKPAPASKAGAAR